MCGGFIGHGAAKYRVLENGHGRGSTCKWEGKDMHACMLGARLYASGREGHEGLSLGGTQACWPSACLGLVSKFAVVGLVGSKFGLSLMGQVDG